MVLMLRGVCSDSQVSGLANGCEQKHRSIYPNKWTRRDDGEGSPWQTIAVTATMTTTQTTVFVRVTQPDQTPPAYVLVRTTSLWSVSVLNKKSIFQQFLPARLSSHPVGNMVLTE